MGKIYFTVEEVNKLIPKIEKEAEMLKALNEEIEIMDNVDVEFKEDSVENHLTVLQLNVEYHEKMAEFYRMMADLTKKGAIVKDLDAGLIDFYSKYGGRDIYLCWKLGEKKIAFWHEIHTGFKGRKPISILRAEIEEKLRRLR